MAVEPVISFRNFSFRYDAQKRPTLHDISLDIYAGEKVVIVGPSGSGKSTLGSCLNGLIPFSYGGDISGSLTIRGGGENGGEGEGEFSPATPIAERSKVIGTVLQDTDAQFVGLNAGEDIAFSLENEMIPTETMREQVREVAERVGLADHLTHAPQQLSGGQKQRAALAGVLVDQVDILLFDEPLASLDPHTGMRAIEIIDRLCAQENKTVIIIEHRLEDVLHCDASRIVLIDDGRIVADKPPDTLIRSGLLAKHGLREPLHVALFRYAGLDINAMPLARPPTLDGKQKRRIRHWFHQTAPAPPASERRQAVALDGVSFSYEQEARGSRRREARRRRREERSQKREERGRKHEAHSQKREERGRKHEEISQRRVGGTVPPPATPPAASPPPATPPDTATAALPDTATAALPDTTASPAVATTSTTPSPPPAASPPPATPPAALPDAVLEDVSFAAYRQQIIAIVGENGAGKSTACKLICGFEPLRYGTIAIDEQDAAADSIQERATKVGYVMQNPNNMITKQMVLDEIALGLQLRGVNETEIALRVDEVLETCGLAHYKEYPISALSYGQKKRVTIASILVLKPQVIILDEPTAGQDYRHYTEIMEFLRTINRQLGLTIILITHDMHLMLEYAERAVVLAKGRLLAAVPTAEVLTDVDLIRAASLKETSLYHVARQADIDPKQLVERFVAEERRTRDNRAHLTSHDNRAQTP